jgi:hypothetical protein
MRHQQSGCTFHDSCTTSCFFLNPLSTLAVHFKRVLQRLLAADRECPRAAVRIALSQSAMANDQSAMANDLMREAPCKVAEDLPDVEFTLNS